MNNSNEHLASPPTLSRSASALDAKVTQLGHSKVAEQNSFCDSKDVTSESSSSSSDTSDRRHIRIFKNSRDGSQPWKDNLSDQSLSDEHRKEYVKTKERVRDVVQSILGYGSSAAHDALEVGVSVLQLAPVAGLGAAAQTLLYIWDALEIVESNKLACLSLTERCADILLIVREEVTEAGNKVESDLKIPLMQLNESFESVKTLLQTQAHRPFYKRYLKRKEIQGQIEGCDTKLSNALGLFSLKVQIRSLQRLELVESEQKAQGSQIQADLQKLISSVHRGPNLSQSEPHSPPPVVIRSDLESSLEDNDTSQIKSMKTSKGIVKRAASLSSLTDVRKRLDVLVSQKSNRDFILDTIQLRRLVLQAMEKSSDEEFLELLQIKREQIPDVLEDLQRASQRLDKNDNVVPSEPISSSNTMKDISIRSDMSSRNVMVEQLSEQDIIDQVDQSFIEYSIKTLKRAKSF